MNQQNGPLKLYYLAQDADSFESVGTFDSLGSTWALNPPEITAFKFEENMQEVGDGAKGALFVTAVDMSESTDPKKINTVSLIMLPTPLSTAMSRVVTPTFCTMKGGGLNYVRPSSLFELFLNP